MRVDRGVLADVGTFWRMAALPFALAATLGLAQGERVEPAFHGTLALLAAIVALARPRWRAGALGVGTALLALAALGLVAPGLFGLGPLLGFRLGFWESALHALVGAWGAYAGSREGS